MNNIFKQLLTLSLFVLVYYANAQEKIELVDIKEISKKIIEFEKNEEYQKALDEISRVSPNDSAYMSFLTSKSYYNIKLKNYDEAIKITEEALQENQNDLYYYFIMNNASSYLNTNQYEKAIQQYDKGLERYPKNYMFYYNKGVAYEGLKRYEEAAKMYQISITYNPFYANSHLKLGNLCYQQHLIAQAMMCLNMYLLLDPEGSYSINVLTFCNNMVAKKNENEKIPDLKLSVDDESFEEIDLIINNYAALSDKYKTNNKIELAIVKQNHALFNQLRNYKGNGGFWDKYYVPLYLYINDNNLFDSFTYTICYPVTNEKIKAIVNKNITSIKEFVPLFQKRWATIIGEQEEVIDGIKKKVLFSYENSKIDGYGEYKNDKTIGKWVFFKSNGSINSIGSFNEKGERDGSWIWYDKNGNILETVSYKDGKLDGEYFLYFENGKVKTHGFYKEGKLNGLYEKYSEKGALLERYTNIDDNIDGEFLSFYSIGQEYIEYKVPYTNGKIDGLVIRYFPDGKIQSEIPFKDGLRNGVEKKYYYNGQLEYKKEFKENNLTGEYTEYHPNGQISFNGFCTNGFFEGPFKQFYSNGKLEKELNYSKGKLEGVYKKNDTDGKIHYEYTYRDGEVIAYKFYNKNNEIIKEAKKQKGEFYYEGHASNGNITSEGSYNIAGGKKGSWKFYNDNHVLTSEENYNDNKVEGVKTEYYTNGKISSVANYRADTVNGYYSSFYKYGQLKQQGWYVDGEAVGFWIDYYPDGKIQSKNYYSNDKQNGFQESYNVDGKITDKTLYKFGNLITEIYYNEKGDLMEEINIDVDSAHYILTNHFNNKKINNKFNMLYGKKQGKYISYHFNGEVSIEGSYLNGEKHGEWKWYYPNGKIETVGVYAYGNKEGIWKDYHDNGKLDSETPFLFGRINGVEKTYNEIGVLTQTRDFEEGVLQGEINFYSEEGKLQITRHYINGILVGYNYLDKNGTKLPLIPIINETAKIVSYFDNGKVAREMELKNGEFVNQYKEYYYSGQLYEEQEYVDDDRHGKWKMYYPDGKLEKERDYFYGNLHGEAKEYFPNGTLKKITPYLNNVINGMVKTYNELGKLVVEETYFGGEITSIKKY